MPEHEEVLKLISYLKNYKGPSLKIMEVCGSHTRAISEYGLRQILPPAIELISGPGCPICVTPDVYIEAIRSYIAKGDGQILCFGDLLRLPQMQGIDRQNVHMIYSPAQSLEIAKKYPHKPVILVAIAFETTAPIIAFVIKKAYEMKLTNLKVWCGLKRMPPVLRQLSKKQTVNGYLYPGHVAAVIGEEPFKHISQEYNLPGVITGFRLEEILVGIAQLIKLISSEQAVCRNAYPQVVRPEGNKLAQQMMQQVFETRNSLWRGIGNIPYSGYGLKEPYKAFEILPKEEQLENKASKGSACLCDEIVMGKKKPEACSLWGKACTTGTPQGSCMASAEGACAIAYQFNRRGKYEGGH